MPTEFNIIAVSTALASTLPLAQNQLSCSPKSAAYNGMHIAMLPYIWYIYTTILETKGMLYYILERTINYSRPMWLMPIRPPTYIQLHLFRNFILLRMMISLFFCVCQWTAFMHSGIIAMPFNSLVKVTIEMFDVNKNVFILDYHARSNVAQYCWCRL